MSEKVVAIGTCNMSSVLTEVVKGLCRKNTSNKVRVKETSLTRTVTFTVDVPASDYGKVIGSGARNFRALELIVRLMAAKEGKEGILSVLPPRDKTPGPSEKFKLNPQWGNAQIRPLVHRVAGSIFEGGKIEIVDPDLMTSNVEIVVNADDEPSIYLDGFHKVSPMIESEDGTLTGFDAVNSAFRTVFHAIGKSNGRNVYLTVVPFNYPGKEAA